jgi:glycosyltransferase involved in cell wall biosynthesis
MKILHAVQAYYPFQEMGGPVFKVRALATGLASRGHDVTVVTPDLGLKKYPELQRRLQRHEYGWWMESDGVKVIYLSTMARYRALTVNPSLRKLCKNALRNYDVVHCYGLYDLMGPTVGYFCRDGNIPYIVEPMGMYRPIDRSIWLKLLWHRTLGKALLQGAAAIVATSEIEKWQLLDGGIPQAQVVLRYNGVDARMLANLPARGTFRAKWNLPADEPIVLFLSRLIPRKGADLLIDAFAKVCAERGRLVIAGPEGESGYVATLKKRAQESGVEARILFCGPVYDEDKRAALRDADIFVLASRYENFANVAAEAMACGVPMIVGKACGISPLVEGQAGLVIDPEAAALTEALFNLINDKGLYGRLKEGCRRVSNKLNWETLTGEMETHYRTATTGGRQSRAQGAFPGRPSSRGPR